MSGPRKGRRQLAELLAETSVRERAILTSLGELRLMSARQIERLQFTADDQAATALSRARHCRRTLERLVRERLLVRLERRIGGLRAGSAAFVYALGPVGQRLISLPGARRRYREPSALFVAHSLAVSELYVRLHEAERAGTLQLLSPIEAEPRCWRRLPDYGGHGLLKPDLAVHLAAGAYEYRWFVELDLGTEHRPALVRKCQAFERYYRSGLEQAAHGVFPRVLWIAPDEVRARRIQHVVDHTAQLTAGLFVVTTSDDAVTTLTGGAEGDVREPAASRPASRAE
ncbi:MAG TPA: replication-relaxation family protein [Acidimicrobiales bacterium]|nr:replication-relaxation family protein [Acidimicrobiales bacterium]